MAAFRPGTTPVKAGSPTTDTTRFFSASKGLNQPSILNADTLRRVFPVFFCGEELPLSQSTTVSRRWLHTLLAQGAQSESMYRLRQRAASFFSVIDPILKQYHIPSDFRFLPLAESELNNKSVSPKGASGYWQLMPGTARELGLTVRPSKDERQDLPKATRAVCRHLRELYQELGSWTLVAAAYNGGINRVQAQIRRQHHRNYYKLRLKPETNQYLYRVLAYKELMTSPQQYRRVLSNAMLVYLTRPLPAWLQTKSSEPLASVSLKEFESEAGEASPTWGPRVDRTLLEKPSETEQWLAEPITTPTDANSDLAEGPAKSPIAKLMSLIVLRFKRPRSLRQKAGRTRRPIHFWEWV